MSDVENPATALGDAAPAPTAKNPRPKKSVPKPSAHPKYEEMVKAAILTLKDRKGSSRQAIKKHIAANFKDLGNNHDAQINNAIKRGVEKGIFAVPKGHSGSVKLIKPEKSTEKKPKATKKKAEGERSVPMKIATAKKDKVAVSKPQTSKTATKKASPSKATTGAQKKMATKAKAVKKSTGGRKKEAKVA